MSSSIATPSQQAPAPPSRWPRPAIVDASVGLHACAGALAFALPGAELWSLSAVLLNHAVLTGAGLLPRSSLLGPNMRRLPSSVPTAPGAGLPAGRVALTFDDGPDPEVTPRVLDLLDAAGARATFFCVADRVRQHAPLAREIVARGHSVQNHSHSHRHHFSFLGPRGFAAEIGAAQQTIAEVTGTVPHCFRAPAGLRNPLLDPVLHRMNLHLVSWTRRGFDTVDAAAPRVLARLTHGLDDGDILLLHDGHARRGPDGEAVSLAVLPALLAKIQARGLTTVTLAEAVSRRHAAERTA